MNTTFRHISFFLLTALLAGCAERDLVTPGMNSADQIPIQLSAAYPTATRASDAGFEDGDRMGVYVMDYKDSSPESISEDGIHASNVLFQFDGTDNTWTGAMSIYWTSNSTPADIIGYYPFISTIDDPTSVSFSIARRQDETGTNVKLGGYEASDILWAKAVKAMPTVDRVDLTFNHIMAGVRVTLAKGTGFTESEWTSVEKKAMVCNILPNAIVNLQSGEVKEVESGTAINVVPYSASDDWRAVVVPQTVKAGADVISVTVDGVSYSLTKDSDFTYISGKLHNFTITVNKKSNDGGYEFLINDESITAWIDTTDFRDGLIKNYQIIEVDRVGTLAEQIEINNIDPSRMMNVKIVGPIDNSDFEFIRDNMKILTSLNLRDAIVYDGDQPFHLPEGALNNMQTLSHFVFPSKITHIGNAALQNTGLIGDLIIPEGVIEIGVNDEAAGYKGAFAYCRSLVGTLTIPSTLQIIGNGTFFGVPFHGSLNLPQSLTAIGNHAFSECHFSGELLLPDNLKWIGTEAFYKNSFSGMLTIPQGVTVINEVAFRDAFQSGTLVLHDGIKEIKYHAFNGCKFQGELILPKKLKLLGNTAFYGNKFSNIKFPEGLTYIGVYCFGDNSRLSGRLEIPSGVTSIKSNAFSNCTMLDEIVIGENITKIDSEAFAGCYNVSSIIINNPNPPILGNNEGKDPFYDIPKDNFTIQVPKGSVELYRQANGWKEFKRIAEYSNFVCRPSTACALNTTHRETLVLNSDGAWTVTHKPDWCTVSKTSGNGKSELTLTINQLSKGSANREDYVEFTLDGTDFTTQCKVCQYDYEYGEDECVTLQKASKGNGIDILFLGDGFDAKSISEGEYMDLVNEQMEYFFGIEPYTTYRDRFNVYTCISLSQETGVNTANTWRNTCFGTLYSTGCGGVGSALMFEDADKVFDYAAAKSPLTKDKMPQSLIIMALNSDEYGSNTIMTWNGSAISICSRSSAPYPMDSRGIIQHEACGHGFGKLAEERITRNAYVSSGQKNEIHEAQSRGWYPNISTIARMSDVLWSHMIFDPRYSDVVDVFEGAYGVTRGVYRCEINSCMNYGIPYFSAISRQEIMRRILDYSGEGFTMDKFYATDSDKWGSTGSTRAAMPRKTDAISSGIHRPVTIIKSKKY